MIIYLDNFKKYSKLIQKISDDAHPYYEMLYFDFENNYCYVTRRETQARIRFNWEKEDNDKNIENVFVNANSFIPLIFLNSDYLNYDGTKFYKGKDKFKIMSKRVKNGGLKGLNPELRDYSVSDNEEIDLTFNEEIWDGLNRASKFMGTNSDDLLAGIFIREGRLFSSIDIAHYIEDLRPHIPEDLEFIISCNLYTLLKVLHGQELSLYKREKCIVISCGSEIDIVTQNNNRLKHLISDFKNFDALFSYDNMLEIDRKDILEIFKFLNNYTDNLSTIHFTEEDGSLMSEIREENIVTRELPIKNIKGDLSGLKMSVRYESLKKAFTDLIKTDIIPLYVKKDRPPKSLLNVKIENQQILFKFAKS